MSQNPRPIARPRRRSPRVPPFFPVPLRATRYGWTVERQADFIGCLAESGSVSGCTFTSTQCQKAAELRRFRREFSGLSGL
jgi:hypothetical protein